MKGVSLTKSCFSDVTSLLQDQTLDSHAHQNWEKIKTINIKKTKKALLLFQTKQKKEKKHKKGLLGFRLNI